MNNGFDLFVISNSFWKIEVFFCQQKVIETMYLNWKVDWSDEK